MSRESQIQDLRDALEKRGENDLPPQRVVNAEGETEIHLSYTSEENEIRNLYYRLIREMRHVSELEKQIEILSR